MAKPPPPLFSMKGSMTAVHSLAFKHDEDNILLFAGTQSGHLHVWDLKINRELAKFSVGDDPVLAIHYINQNLITQNKVGQIGIWEEIDSKWILKQSLSQNYLSFCKSVVGVLSGELIMACADSNSVTQVLSLVSHNVLFSLQLKNPHEKLGEVMAMKFVELNEKLFLLSVYECCLLLLWDLHDKKILSKLKISEDCPMAFDFDEMSMRGLCGSGDDNLILFKISEGNSLVKKSEIKITNPGVSCIRIRQDKKIVAVGCWDGMIRIYSWRSLKMLAVLDHHDSTIHEVCFLNKPVVSWKSKKLLAVAGKDAKISIWDLYND